MSGGRLAELRKKATNRLARGKEVDVPEGIPQITTTAEGPHVEPDPQVSALGSEPVTPTVTIAVAANASPPSRDPKRTVVDLDKPSRPSKKRRENTDKRHRSYPFRVEEFVNASMEEFRSDPIMSSVNVFKHFGDLYKAEKETAESCIREVVKERDATTNKRDETIKKLESTSKALARVRNELSELKEEKKKLEEARGSDAERLRELEDRALKAEYEAKKLKESNDCVPSLEAELKKVNAELVGETEAKERLKADLEKVDGELTKTLQDMCSLADEVFENALR